MEAHGLPTAFYDAAAETDDTYVELIADSNRRYNWLSIQYLDTQPAMLSFDGGTTDHLPVSVIVNGWRWFHIPAGFTQLHAKNLTATNDYANLRGAAW